MTDSQFTMPGASLCRLVDAPENEATAHNYLLLWTVPHNDATSIECTRLERIPNYEQPPKVVEWVDAALRHQFTVVATQTPAAGLAEWSLAPRL